MATAAEQTVVEGLHSFAVAAGRASGRSCNLVFSPLSIAAAFAMAAAGAAEATYTDIARVFGFPDDAALHPAMAALVDLVDQANGDDVTIEIADAVWGQDGLALGPAFVETLARDYDAAVRSVDFAGDTEGARQAINQWVAKVTRGRIDPLLVPGALDPATEVALVNAVYLYARWRHPFDKALTVDRPFTLVDGSTVDVPTMHKPEIRLPARVGPDLVAVKLPYVGDTLAMVAILPPETTSLATFEAGLDGAALASITTGLTQQTRLSVKLTLPRWDIGSSLDLAVPLGALGLPIPGGDLSPLAPGAFIGAAVHAANITVDETSTEAAAATAIMVGRAAFDPTEPIPIVVDRPFLFVVLHEATGVPLFYGRITDPGTRRA